MNKAISNKLFCYILLFSILQANACKSSLKKVVARYASGTPRTVYEYPDRRDSLTYIIRIYYPDGRIYKVGTVKNGLFADKKITYFESGKIHQIDSLSKPCDKQADACDGSLIRYNENGTISQHYIIRNGQFNGLSQHYNGNGVLVKSYYLRNDSIKDGEYFEFYDNGIIARKATYKNDTLTGYEYFFKENGDTAKYYSHYKGNIDFPYKKWLENGNTLVGNSLNSNSVIWIWRDKSGKELKRIKLFPDKSGFRTPE